MSNLLQTPLGKRPRERLQQVGAQQLNLEELIAVILRTGSAHEDVLMLSHQVARLLEAGRANLYELSQIRGIGKVKAAEILAALQLERALTQRLNGRVLSHPSEIYRSCQDLISLPQEHLVVFYLTSRNQQIQRDTVSVGTANASLLHPREVFRSAITHNSTHIALAHNHPSGDPTPSNADRLATRRIAQAGLQLGIELMDHVICGATHYVSLKTSAPELFL